MKSRREFLADTCKFCMVAVSAGSILTLFDGCGTEKAVTATRTDNGHEVKIPLSSFDKAVRVVVNVPGSEKQILAVKKADGSYLALKLSCTHKGVALNTESRQLSCPAHGSTFDFDGNVTHGPATRPLKSFSAVVSGTDLLIETEDL